MAPCRTPTMANDPGGGGRTYSGVCAAGQATENPGLAGKWGAFRAAQMLGNIHLISRVGGVGLRFRSN
jgi:hypothetical protein